MNTDRPRRRPQGSRTQRPRAPRKPRLPDQRPRLPASVFRDLRSAARAGELDDVAAAYGAAGDALDRGEVERAVELLQWAKSAAARSAAVREALGVALYHAGDYAAATTELLAYRRLSGREDQNHLLADCARALGRGDKVAEYVEAMDPATAGADRYAEGVIVLAAHQADEGDVDRAAATIERLAGQPSRVDDWHLRVWHLAAELHERRGDTAAARDYLEAIAAVDADYLDVGERLARLDADEAGDDTASA